MSGENVNAVQADLTYPTDKLELPAPTIRAPSATAPGTVVLGFDKGSAVVRTSDTRNILTTKTASPLPPSATLVKNLSSTPWTLPVALVALSLLVAAVAAIRLHRHAGL